jgi:hypothetical protein
VTIPLQVSNLEPLSTIIDRLVGPCVPLSGSFITLKEAIAIRLPDRQLFVSSYTSLSPIIGPHVRHFIPCQLACHHNLATSLRQVPLWSALHSADLRPVSYVMLTAAALRHTCCVPNTISSARVSFLISSLPKSNLVLHTSTAAPASCEVRAVIRFLHAEGQSAAEIHP